jgi:hypothetical protein
MYGHFSTLAFYEINRRIAPVMSDLKEASRQSCGLAMKLAAPQGLGDRGHCSGCNAPWNPNSLPPLIIPGQDHYLPGLRSTLSSAFSCKLP